MSSSAAIPIFTSSARRNDSRSSPIHVFAHLEFEDTAVEDWLKMQAALGLSRGLHVQSMMYENNYEIVLHTQSLFPGRLRAVAIPWPGITDNELRILTECGVVGYRVTH